MIPADTLKFPLLENSAARPLVSLGAPNLADFVEEKRPATC